MDDPDTVKEAYRTLTARIDANEKLQAEKWASHTRALEVALKASDKRLDGMNELRGALEDLSKLMLTRTEGEQARDTLSNKMDAELAPIKEKINEMGKPNWTLAVSILLAVFVLVGAAYSLVGLKVENATAPNARDIAVLWQRVYGTPKSMPGEK